VGIISLIPGLTNSLIGVFGLGQILWLIWLGIVLLRSRQSISRRPLNLAVEGQGLS